MRKELLVSLVLLFVSPVVRAADWTSEARQDRGTDPAVKEAAMAYDKSGEWSEITTGMSVKVPYGEREAVLLCAPLRISTIALEAGETVHEVVLGDEAHWQVLDLGMGPGGETPIIGVRPTLDLGSGDTCDRTTNLVITTDRRLYTILLELLPCKEGEGYEVNPQRVYHQRLSFFYPAALVQRWTSRAQMRARQREEAVAASVEVSERSVGKVEDLHFDYRIKRQRRRDFPWIPRVFDNGSQTFIQLPEGARELAAVFERRDSKDAVIDFSVVSSGSMVVLPNVYKEIVLVVPGGSRLSVRRVDDE